MATSFYLFTSRLACTFCLQWVADQIVNANNPSTVNEALSTVARVGSVATCLWSGQDFLDAEGTAGVLTATVVTESLLAIFPFQTIFHAESDLTMVKWGLIGMGTGALASSGGTYLLGPTIGCVIGGTVARQTTRVGLIHAQNQERQ